MCRSASDCQCEHGNSQKVEFSHDLSGSSFYFCEFICFCGIILAKEGSYTGSVQAATLEQFSAIFSNPQQRHAFPPISPGKKIIFMKPELCNSADVEVSIVNF